MIQNLSVYLRVFKHVYNFEDNTSVPKYHFDDVIKEQTTNKIIEEGWDCN